MMAVCRIEKNKNYTVMANYHLGDARLSLKAVGLLSKMLSLPEDWDYTIGGLTRICREGKDAIRAAIVELEEAGYIQRRQLHDETGAFSGNEYVIYESPLSGFPSTENPLTENPTELNTKLLNTYNPPIVPPQGDGGERATKKQARKRGEPKSAPDWKPDRFEKFWATYPRGEAKQRAIQAWDRLQPDESTLRQMALGLMRYMASEEWKRGIGIPHASAWINQRRWEDDLKKTPNGDGKDDRQPFEEVKGAYRL